MDDLPGAAGAVEQAAEDVHAETEGSTVAADTPIEQPSAVVEKRPRLVSVNKSLLDNLLVPNGLQIISGEPDGDNLVLIISGDGPDLQVLIEDQWDEHFGTRRVITWKPV